MKNLIRLAICLELTQPAANAGAAQRKAARKAIKIRKARAGAARKSQKKARAGAAQKKAGAAGKSDSPGAFP